MAEKHPNVVGQFYKVGPIYYYDRTEQGRRLRVSTMQTSLESAAQWVMERPFGSHHIRKPINLKPSFVTRIIGQAKANAKARSIPFAITQQDFWEMYDATHGYCAVSGLPFDMRELDAIKRRPFMPSIDRVNSFAGYTRENCRVVCTAVNLAMNEFGEDVLWQIASSMVILRRKQRKAA